MADALGSQAVAALDTLLADRPDKADAEFAAATVRLAAWRDAWIARWRKSGTEADRRRLERLNAALSAVVGAQFPLGGVPWELLTRTRADLAALVNKPA